MYSKRINHNLRFKDRNFTVNSTKTDLNVYLSHEEIAKILALKLEGTKDIIRDWFVIACYTALRHSDWKQLVTADLTGNYLEILIQKTGRFAKIPFHPIVKRIFAKYDYKMPHVFSIKTVNDELKKIVKQAGINQKFLIDGEIKEKWELCGSHTGRRSACTNAYDDGWPLKKIMGLSQHMTTSQLLDYIKKTADEEAEWILDKMNNDPRFAVANE